MKHDLPPNSLVIHDEAQVVVGTWDDGSTEMIAIPDDYHASQDQGRSLIETFLAEFVND